MTEMREIVEELRPSVSDEKRGLFRMIKKECIKARKFFNKFMDEAKVYETMDQVTKYLMANPVLLAACVSIFAVIAIPLLIFILFTVINVAFVFTGFIAIEVAVLTIGATVLFCALLSMITTIVITGLSCAFTWYIICYILSFTKNFKIMKH